MKKFAYIVMGPHYRPEHKAVFETEGSETHILTARDFDEAKEHALWCSRQGFGVIELCGAFGERHAREIKELTGGEMGIGYVVNLPEQSELIGRFFSK